MAAAPAHTNAASSASPSESTIVAQSSSNSLSQSNGAPLNSSTSMIGPRGGMYGGVGVGSGVSGYGSTFGSSMYGSGGMYGSSYGSSYGGGMYGSGSRMGYGGGYGGYGGGYSSYGSGYGGMSRYGGGIGYGAGRSGMYGNGYGMGGMHGGNPLDPSQQPPASGMNALVQSGYQKMDTFYTVVDGFSRFSELMQVNLEAFQISLDALATMVFHVGSALNYLKVSISNSTLVRLIVHLANKFMDKLAPKQNRKTIANGSETSKQEEEKETLYSKIYRGRVHLLALAVSAAMLIKLIIEWRRSTRRSRSLEKSWSV